MVDAEAGELHCRGPYAFCLANAIGPCWEPIPELTRKRAPCWLVWRMQTIVRQTRALE